MMIVTGDPTPHRIVMALPDGEIHVVVPNQPVPDGMSVEHFCRFVAMYAQACGGLNGEAWADDAEHVATIHRDELDRHKRWRGFTRFNGKSPLPIVTIKRPLRWDFVSKSLVVDEALARQQIIEELRHERDVVLKESDADHARIGEIGTAGQKARLAEYRQRLRDFPATVAAAIAGMGVAELEKYKPELPVKPT